MDYDILSSIFFLLFHHPLPYYLLFHLLSFHPSSDCISVSLTSSLSILLYSTLLYSTLHYYTTILHYTTLLYSTLHNSKLLWFTFLCSILPNSTYLIFTCLFSARLISYLFWPPFKNLFITDQYNSYRNTHKIMT